MKLVQLWQELQLRRVRMLRWQSLLLLWREKILRQIRQELPMMVKLMGLLNPARQRQLRIIVHPQLPGKC